MAKSLKLKIKNAQLAEAIKLNQAKQDKEDASQTQASMTKESMTKEKTPSERPPSLQPLSQQPNHLTENGSNSVCDPGSFEAAQTTFSHKDTQVKKPQKPLSVGKVVFKPSDKVLIPKSNSVEENESKRIENDQKSIEAPKGKEKEDAPKPDLSQGKGFKANFGRNFRAIPKKQESRFDARDKQGLRTEDERMWRRRPRRMKSKKEGTEILRPKELSVRLPISVKDLAQSMKLKASELIAKLFMQGVIITINDFLDDETTVQLLGEEFSCSITIDTSEEERLRITDDSIQEEIAKTDPSALKKRPPVVAFMGHVDHGKTSLIDAMRKSNIAGGEAGAITQHIGAFKCRFKNGEVVVLDTPGHEAFTLMRQRGTAVTDIIVLVVAGDEGVMPQTEEAMTLAKKANIPIVVAINKCDKVGFNAENVYRQLADKEVLPEAWGGNVITVNCSAQTGVGLDSLLEMLLLQSEILELKANPNARARGTVIESRMHKGFGPVATILVQNGTLKLGDPLVFEDLYARVKTMHDENEQALSCASPATPVKITGLSGIPAAGSDFIVVESEKEARSLAKERAEGEKSKRLQRSRGELENYMTRHQELEEKKVLPLILRADVQGSVEAIRNFLLNIQSKKVELNIISEGVGEISESDVELAIGSNAAIIGFHTQIETHAEDLIKQNQVVIKTRDIIYQLVDEVKQLMLDSLDKVRQETEKGTLEIQQVFKSSQLGSIAGCLVIDGTIKRDYFAKVLRKGQLVHQGEIQSIKRLKEDVKEVSKGLECGILLQKFSDYQQGDIVKCFQITYVSQSL